MRVCLQALMEVVESGSKNIEVAVMRPNAKLEVLPEEQIEAVCKVLLFEVFPLSTRLLYYVHAACAWQVIEAEKAAAAEAAGEPAK